MRTLAKSQAHPYTFRQLVSLSWNRMGFTKLWSTLVFSTVWREEMHVKVVWITMLALADQKGIVSASVPGLADVAKVSLPQCEDALKRLHAPDPYSRTKDHEGRRLETVDGGWFVINHEKYRGMRDEETRREQVRQAVGRHRERERLHMITVNNVSHVSHGKPKQKQKQKQKQKKTSLGPSARDIDFATAWAHYPKRAGGNSKQQAEICWKARVSEGISPSDILAGIDRYAAFCAGTGKLGTEYVKQARTFLGPAGHWSEPWELPVAQTPKYSGKLDWAAAAKQAEEDDRG